MDYFVEGLLKDIPKKLFKIGDLLVSVETTENFQNWQCRFQLNLTCEWLIFCLFFFAETQMTLPRLE